MRVLYMLLLYCIVGYAYGDGDVISMPAVFRRHVVGKCFHCDIAEMRFIGKTLIT